jgi:hypothetical protein
LGWPIEQRKYAHINIGNEGRRHPLSSITATPNNDTRSNKHASSQCSNSSLECVGLSTLVWCVYRLPHTTQFLPLVQS